MSGDKAIEIHECVSILDPFRSCSLCGRFVHFVATLLAFIRVFLKWIEWRRIFIRIISLGLSFFKFLISFSFDVSVIPTYDRAGYIIKFYFYLRVKIMIV